MASNFPLRSSLMAVLTIALVTSGCITSDDGTVRTGDLRTDTTFLELGEADAVSVDLVMGTGDLRIGSGATDLLVIRVARIQFSHLVP